MGCKQRFLALIKASARLDQGVERLERMAGDAVIVVRGGGQGRAGELRKRVIVMRGDPQGAPLPAPDPEAVVIAGGQQPDRQPVIAAQHRAGGKSASLQHPQRTVAPNLLKGPAFAIDLDDMWLQAEPLHGLQIGGPPLVRIGIGWRAHFEKTGRLTRPGQIVDGLRDETEIIRSHKGFADAVDIAVKQHRWHILAEFFDHPFVGGPAKRRQQDAGRLQGPQAVEDFIFKMLLAVGAVERWAEPGLKAAALHSPGDFGKERIGQIRHHNADILCQLAVLVHRENVRPVVEFLQRLFDTLPGRLAHTRRIVEIFGDSRPGDAAGGRKLLHVLQFPLGHALAHFATSMPDQAGVLNALERH